MVASGRHWAPKYPDWATEAEIDAIHSHDYRTREQLAGRDVHRAGDDLVLEQLDGAARGQAAVGAQRGIRGEPGDARDGLRQVCVERLLDDRYTIEGHAR